ncbi:MAG: thioesterase family protein [Nocardioidaceae bacterium]|nr:thioesterase family protein [Nocardioidaceae bacterium]MCL2614427.1 thioesterase family protein [Nocardioidaceae bacterium]
MTTEDAALRTFDEVTAIAAAGDHRYDAELDPLSTYVRALPAPGPVQVVMRANLVHGDRVDESVTIRDSGGRVVAQSHQLAAIRFG